MNEKRNNVFIHMILCFVFLPYFFRVGDYNIDVNQLLPFQRIIRANIVKNRTASTLGRSSNRAEFRPMKGWLVEVRRMSRRRRPNKRRRNWLQLIRIPRVWLTENCRILCSSLVRMYKVMFLRRKCPPIRACEIDLIGVPGGAVSIEVVVTKFVVVLVLVVTVVVVVVIVVVAVTAVVVIVTAAPVLSSVVKDKVVIGTNVDWVVERVRRLGRAVVTYSSASLPGSPGLKKFAVSLFFVGRWWKGRAAWKLFKS